MSNQVFATAPSNIALIKYMGKTEAQTNSPTNASLSYTLEHLRSIVSIESVSQPTDLWAPLRESGWEAPVLSHQGQERFLRHFLNLKTEWGIQGSFRVCSANNFPSDCGIASSASSFAALTLAAYELAKAKGVECPRQELSALSRKGSGSSCRSLFSPWSLWKSEMAEELPELQLKLAHQVVVVSSEKKQVSSSEAHLRVASSPLFENRVTRAHLRLDQLIKSLKQRDWWQAYEVCYEEFEDMHKLFESSEPSFSYRTAESQKALKLGQDLWRQSSDGPLITMDAGPNVHFLWKQNQLAKAKEFSKDLEKLGSVYSSPELQDV